MVSQSCISSYVQVVAPLKTIAIVCLTSAMGRITRCRSDGRGRGAGECCSTKVKAACPKHSATTCFSQIFLLSHRIELHFVHLPSSSL